MPKRAKKVLPPKEVHLTKEGKKEITDEHKLLKEEKLPKAIKRVARARDFGDLSENSEYHSAREDLAFTEGRIEELEAILSRAKLISDKTSAGVVKLGSRVTVNGNGQKHTFTVVGEWEADPIKKKISHESPLGKALVGKKISDEVEIEAPAGKILYKVTKIH